MAEPAIVVGLVGAALIGGAFVAAWREPAIVVGLVSMLSFVVLERLVGGTVSAPLRRVALADVVGSVVLIAAAALGRAG